MSVACRTALLCSVSLAVSMLISPVSAEQTNVVTISIGYLTQAGDRHVPLSILEPHPEDAGIQGARLAIKDNQTTGQFTGQRFLLDEAVVPADGDVAAAFREMVNDGTRLIIVDLPAEQLLAVADLPEATESLLFNIGARDDRLRNNQCRENVLHTSPSRAMLADALAQYLAWKRWREIFLVVGKNPADRAYAQAVKRAVKHFGLEIVSEKEWTFEATSRRSDSGHVTAQQEVPSFTQGADFDVLIVADEGDEFGEYLSYRTHLPRPVAGTHGLTPTAWHRVNEAWGSTQVQRRFHKLSGRWMNAEDYAAWVAVRSIGEAATRTASGDVAQVAAFIGSADFRLAAFKGVPVSFRAWNGQLRQPVLIVAPRILVSVSPQRGFLHQFSTLDTLGYDSPESTCRLGH